MRRINPCLIGILTILEAVYLRYCSMGSSRFSFPTSPNDPNPEAQFMYKGEHDPSELILLDPPQDKLNFCLSQVEVSLHPTVLQMIEHSLTNDLPLDVAILSETAETSRALVEERVTLRVEEGQPTYIRAVVISKLLPPDEIELEYFDEDHRDLALHITKSITGKIEAILTWEDESLSTDLNMLRERWERVDKLYTDLGLPVLPFDLGPLAHDPSGQVPDPLFDYKGTTLAAYPTPPEVILTYHENSPTDERESWGPISPLEDGDPAGIYADEDDEDLDDDDETPSTSNDRKLTPEPGEELTITNPTAIQLSKIANLSGMPASPSLMRKLILAIQNNQEVAPQNFGSLPVEEYENVAISSRKTFQLGGGLSRISKISVEDIRDHDGVGFTINLTHSAGSTSHKKASLQAVLNWAIFSVEAHVENWDRILRLAGIPRK